MKKTAVIAVLVLLGVLALIGVFRTVDLTGAQPVRTVEVGLDTLHTAINTNGIIEAREVFEIRAPAAGRCQDIKVREGDTVKEGQPLLQLEDSGLRTDLAEAKSELSSAEVDLKNIKRGPPDEEVNQARAEVERTRFEMEAAQRIYETNRGLHEKSAIPRFELEESERALARARRSHEAANTRLNDLKNRFDQSDQRRAEERVTAARARIRYLEDMLSRTLVRAPADGTLYSFEARRGSYLQTGQLIGTLADLSDLRVRAFVDEPEMSLVRPGLEVVVRWDSRPSDSWKGTVTRLPSQVVARGTRSVGEVLCTLSELGNDLVPNVNVDVEIVTEAGPRVPSLPRSCVLLDLQGQYVWVIRDGKAAKQTVQTGRSTASVIEIKGGLSQGDRVIVPGSIPMAEGLKVRAEAE